MTSLGEMRQFIGNESVIRQPTTKTLFGARMVAFDFFFLEGL